MAEEDFKVACICWYPSLEEVVEIEIEPETTLQFLRQLLIDFEDLGDKAYIFVDSNTLDPIEKDNEGKVHPYTFGDLIYIQEQLRSIPKSPKVPESLRVRWFGSDVDIIAFDRDQHNNLGELYAVVNAMLPPGTKKWGFIQFPDTEVIPRDSLSEISVATLDPIIYIKQVPVEKSSFLTVPTEETPGDDNSALITVRWLHDNEDIVEIEVIEDTSLDDIYNALKQFEFMQTRRWEIYDKAKSAPILESEFKDYRPISMGRYLYVVDLNVQDSQDMDFGEKDYSPLMRSDTALQKSSGDVQPILDTIDALKDMIDTLMKDEKAVSERVLNEVYEIRKEVVILGGNMESMRAEFVAVKEGLDGTITEISALKDELTDSQSQFLELKALIEAGNQSEANVSDALDESRDTVGADMNSLTFEGLIKKTYRGNKKRGTLTVREGARVKVLREKGEFYVVEKEDNGKEGLLPKSLVEKVQQWEAMAENKSKARIITKRKIDHRDTTMPMKPSRSSTPL